MLKKRIEHAENKLNNLQNKIEQIETRNDEQEFRKITTIRKIIER
jgi:hypothetical protein